MNPRWDRNERGQATVELVLCLPVVALLIGALIHIVMVMGDDARLWQGAREAARVASVDPDLDDIRAAAARSGLEPLRLRVEPVESLRVQGEPVTVELSYRPRGVLPLIGALTSRLELHATATMRIEQP